MRFEEQRGNNQQAAVVEHPISVRVAKPSATIVSGAIDRAVRQVEVPRRQEELNPPNPRSRSPRIVVRVGEAGPSVNQARSTSTVIRPSATPDRRFYEGWPHTLNGGNWSVAQGFPSAPQMQWVAVNPPAVQWNAPPAPPIRQAAQGYTAPPVPEAAQGYSPVLGPTSTQGYAPVAATPVVQYYPSAPGSLGIRTAPQLVPAIQAPGAVTSPPVPREAGNHQVSPRTHNSAGAANTMDPVAVIMSQATKPGVPPELRAALFRYAQKLTEEQLRK